LSRLLGWYQEIGTSPERMLEDEVVHNWEQTSVSSHVR